MKYKQTLHIFYILILAVLIVGVESFTPIGRSGHSSILIGTRLYFFGGVTDDNLSSNEVFYLDVSQTFNIASPPWTDLTMSAKIPFGSSWAGISSIDNNNDPTVYLFGGLIEDSVSGNRTLISNVLTFNVKALEWKIPNINGKVPERRYNVHAVNDNKGKLYIFGGYADSPTIQYFNDMVILDTTSFIWSYGSTFNAPINRGSYSATILTNGIIVYIGGLESTGTENRTIDINKINLYDTNLDTWSVTIAKNTSIIESRYRHSAALAPDGNIMILGGRRNDPAVPETLLNTEPEIAILNTHKTPFEWIVPTVSSNIGKIPSLSGSTANLVGNYMIVTFGRIVPTTTSHAVNDTNSKIYVMDIESYTWIGTFKVIQNETLPSPTKPSTLAPTPSIYVDNKNTNDPIKNAVIGVLGGIIGTAFLSIIGFLGYRWHKKRKRDEILNIPGSIQ